MEWTQGQLEHGLRCVAERAGVPVLKLTQEQYMEVLGGPRGREVPAPKGLSPYMRVWEGKWRLAKQSAYETRLEPIHQCPVCLRDKPGSELEETECGHWGCGPCLWDWCTRGENFKSCPTCRASLTHADGRELPVLTPAMNTQHECMKQEAHMYIHCHRPTKVSVNGNGVTQRKKLTCRCSGTPKKDLTPLTRLRLCCGQSGHASQMRGCYKFYRPQCAGVRDKEGLIFCRSCTWREVEEGRELPEHVDRAVVAEVTEELRLAGKLPGQ